MPNDAVSTEIPNVALKRFEETCSMSAFGATALQPPNDPSIDQMTKRIWISGTDSRNGSGNDIIKALLSHSAVF